MSPLQRWNHSVRGAVGGLVLLAALAYAAGRQDAAKLKIGERLMDGSVVVKATDLKTGADLFECSEAGCVAVCGGSFVFATEGGEKPGQILSPAVRVVVEIAGRSKELAARLAFDSDLVAKIQAPAGAKIIVEPLDFVDLPKSEVASLSTGASTSVKLVATPPAPSSALARYSVQLDPVKIELVPKGVTTDLARGQRTIVSWNLEGAALLPDGASVEVYADAEAGRSPVAFRRPSGRWQDRLTELPTSGSAEALFLSQGAKRLHFELKIAGQTIGAEGSLGFAVADPKLRLELKNPGRRVGDLVTVAAFSDGKPFSGAGLRLEPAPNADGRIALTDSLRAVDARYGFFDGEERDGDERFTATEIRLAGVRLDPPLPRIQTVAFKEGLSTTVEPSKPTVLPIVLRTVDREIDADASDLSALEVVQDPPDVLSSVKVVTTGSASLGIRLTGQRPGAAASLTVKYHGREIATLIVQVDAAVKSGRLYGKFLPLSDDDVERLYGPDVAKGYHVVECTLVNTVRDGPSGAKSDLIVQPESIEFGAVVQSRPKKGGWQIASATATSGAILPGGTLGATGFTIGGILDVAALRGYFANSGKSDAPPVVRLLARHLTKELPDDREHWATALNTATVDMVASLDWTAFAAAYGYPDLGLQTPERERLIRRRLQIDTNEAIIGSEFSYLRWRPLSPEAVNEVFQILAREKREGKSARVARLFLSAGRLISGAGLMGDDGKTIVANLGGVANGLLPTIKQTLPELSEARRRNLALMLFAGPLRLAPQVPTKKHIFVSKEVMKRMFNAEETQISEIVQGSLTADIAIVTSSERTTIGSTDGP